MIIAVDGSAASGKGTLAKRLAARFNLAHLDTGSLYRALGLSLLRTGETAETIDESTAVATIADLDLTLAETAEIRTDRVAGMASVIAAMPSVRAGLVALQRGFATAPPHGEGAVLDGRDIGSVILPDADFKFFIDADLEVRAERRTRELQAAGQSVMFRDVLEDMRDRDRRDRERQTAPLKAADDALIIDSSDLDADSVLARAIDHIGMLRGQ